MLKRRATLVALCIAHLVIAGCLQRTVNDGAPGSGTLSEQQQLAFSGYIRGVYRISQETGPDEPRQALLDSKPELAELAGRIAADQNDIQSRLELAGAYVREGLPWSANHLYQEVRSVAPGNFQAELGLGWLWHGWRESGLALQHANAAVGMDPASAEAYDLLGRIHLHRRAPAEAAGAFHMALDLDPGLAAVSANLGHAYVLMGDWEDAKSAFERALFLEPSLVEARNSLGIVLARMGDYDGALAQMQLAGAPHVALNNFGVLLLSEARLEEAIQAFTDALRHDPDYVQAQENLAAARSLLPIPAVVHVPRLIPAGEASRLAQALDRTDVIQDRSRFDELPHLPLRLLPAEVIRIRVWKPGVPFSPGQTLR